MAEKSLNWGIVGCGHISADFVTAMVRNSQRANKICAVATSNSLERAREFVSRHFDGPTATEAAGHNPKTYGSYAELLSDAEVDIVYVGVLNHQHKDTVLSALESGKHVLCEKPLGLNAREVGEMVAKAREKGRFLMEAYWTRFFPAWQTVKQQMADLGGPPQVVLCDFGYASHNVTKTELKFGGGYLLATGCYPIMIVSWIFGGERPTRIKACGTLGEKKTDLWAGVTLEYSNNRVANIFYTGLLHTPCQCTISGPNGHFKLPERFWCPIKIVEEIEGKADRCSNLKSSNVLNFPLPDNTKEASSMYNFPNSSGLSYEADHVFDCLKNGQLQSDVMPLEESIVIAETLDEIRRQLGVIYPQDSERE